MVSLICFDLISSSFLQNGAEFIYPLATSKDASTPEQNLPDLNSRWMLSFNSSSGFDVASHFGCNMSAPPADTKMHYSLCNFVKFSAIYSPAVVDQKLVQDSPRCDTTAPSVALMNGSFIQISINKSIFHRSAFWALPVLVWTSDLEVTWQHYIQWLLWRTGSFVLVFWNGLQNTAPGSPRNTTVFLKDLDRLSCSVEFSFELCVQSIVSTLNKQHVSTIKLWFKALQNVGYTFPKISMDFKETTKSCTKVEYRPINYSSIAIYNKRNRNIFVPVSNSEHSTKMFESICESKNRTRLPLKRSTNWDVTVDFNRPWFQRPNILLIVIFNKPHYDVIPQLEAIYRSYFPLMLYCGPDFPNLDDHPRLLPYKFSFLTYDRR